MDGVNDLNRVRLHKLLYFIEGLYMAKYASKLFGEEYEIWKYRPVIRDLHYRYKEYIQNGDEELDKWISSKLNRRINKDWTDERISYINQCLELTFDESTSTLISEAQSHWSYTLVVIDHLTGMLVVNKKNIRICFMETYKLNKISND